MPKLIFLPANLSTFKERKREKSISQQSHFEVEPDMHVFKSTDSVIP